ncbi:hypothetical protein L1987_55606 [Smallanthus sonchifolius]|uniref:Uncharacterized protein n=1 Tax=Smallanthus sonchifolius TaxID=185202 RepID=A0ACB9EAT8_9ASTR|nr:hypothetical protein L1987_55606 [Smallanthus sonchifolius]
MESTNPWPELLGSNNWEGILDITLRTLILRCGDFCQATYDAFNNDGNSNRDLEWINVLGVANTSVEPLLRQRKFCPSTDSDADEDENEGVPKVMQGWLKIYTSDNPNSSFTKLSARTQVLTGIKQLVAKYEKEDISIIITGHSLGACLSTLSAFDLAENGITNIPISAFVFGSPQVGNQAFNDRLNQFSNVKILHVRNKIDLLTRYPSRLLRYRDSGVPFEIDTRKSGSLKRSMNNGDWHNLQGMLHVVAGWNGEDGESELKVSRSLALVNKSSEFLKDEYLIPGSWWVEKNKGMVMNENGDWVLEPPDEEDIPVPEYEE